MNSRRILVCKEGRERHIPLEKGGSPDVRGGMVVTKRGNMVEEN